MWQNNSWIYQNKFFIQIAFVCLLFFLTEMISYAQSETIIPLCKKEWATPMQRPGLPNFHKVTNELYRGAQPTAEGMQELKKMGIKTVINLRSFHSDRNKLGNTGLGYEHIYMKAWHPEEKEIIRFLQIVMNKEQTPIFVHCQHGADRTGTMCAIYRIILCGWSKAEAIKEMTEGGFGFHTIWTNIVPFIEKLDIEKIREGVRIKN